AAPPVAFIARVARPVVWLLSTTTDVVARLVGGGSGDDAGGLLTDEEVLDVIATEADFAPAQRALVTGAIELRQRAVREVLVPRRDVLVLDPELTASEAARRLAAEGHSRAPVGVDGELDEVVGVALLATLVAHDDPAARVADACGEPVVVPEGAVVHEVLSLL